MGFGGAGLDALLLGDPLELEGWEGGQDGWSHRSMEYFLSGVDLRVVRGEACYLPLHAVSEAREHVGTTRQNNVPHSGQHQTS